MANVSVLGGGASNHHIHKKVLSFLAPFPQNLTFKNVFGGKLSDSQYAVSLIVSVDSAY